MIPTPAKKVFVDLPTVARDIPCFRRAFGDFEVGSLRYDIASKGTTAPLLTVNAMA